MWWPVTGARDAAAMADRKPSSRVHLVKREGRKGTRGKKRTCCEGAVAWGTRTWREQVATTLQWRRGSSKAQSNGVGGRERTRAQRTAMSVWARPVGRLLLGPA
jgi:hypothetical protein